MIKPFIKTVYYSTNKESILNNLFFKMDSFIYARSIKQKNQFHNRYFIRKDESYYSIEAQDDVTVSFSASIFNEANVSRQIEALAGVVKRSF